MLQGNLQRGNCIYPYHLADQLHVRKKTMQPTGSGLIPPLDLHMTPFAENVNVTVLFTCSKGLNDPCPALVPERLS
jgi:hypothetical protein